MTKTSLMKARVVKWYEDMQCDWYFTKMEHDSNRRQEEKKPFPSILLVPGFVFEIFHYYYRELLCKWLGHKWVDISYATPDTGYMGCECERCGEESGQILY